MSVAQQAGVLGGTYTRAPESLSFLGAPFDVFVMLVFILL